MRALPVMVLLFLRWMFIAVVLAGVAGVWAQGVLVVPALTAHVMDSTGTLDTDAKQALENKLTTFEASQGSQIVVLMVPTTAPEDIASYTQRVADSWKIGRKQVGDGLLLVVAKDDRKLRIEVAKSLEGAIPDLMAKRVIDQAIFPLLKAGDFAGGIDAGIDQIMGLIRSEGLPAAATGVGVSGGKAGFQWMDLAVFLFFAVVVGGGIARQLLGNRLGSLATGGIAGAVAMFVTTSVVVSVLAAIAAVVLTLFSSLNKVTTNHGSGPWGDGGWGGRGSGRFGGGTGGGFSSGGGGNFGGGGASGGW
ncbi:MAG: hypothetical protein RL682_1956 [Pseudomonadota bacterium]